MNKEESEAAYLQLLRLKDIPVPIRMSDEQEKAYEEWQKSEDRKQMVDAAIQSLAEEEKEYDEIFIVPETNLRHALLDFYKDSTEHFKGRADEEISLEEVTKFIRKWVKQNFI